MASLHQTLLKAKAATVAEGQDKALLCMQEVLPGEEIIN